MILIIWFNFLYFLEESEYRYFIKVNFDIYSMLSCVDIHWFDRILCNFIYSQWFDGLEAHALGLVLVLILVLQLMIRNNEMVCHVIWSDLIWSDSSQYTLSSWSSGIYMRIRIECVMKQTYSDLSSRQYIICWLFTFLVCIIAVLQSYWIPKSWKSIWCIKYRMFNVDEQTNWRILNNVYMISCKWELSSSHSSAYLCYVIRFYIKIQDNFVL